MHAYLADGFHAQWLENIERARSQFDPETVFYVGHGSPAAPALLDWQAAYIRTLLDAVQAVDPGESSDAAVRDVTLRMKSFLDTDDLLFLMQLSVPALQRS
jgi:glyoxylase-like metal-dependent hydrolase (beta-lactamase superfamily II)